MPSPEVDPSPTTSDYEKDFLRILNNRAKERGPKAEARSRGFVVITRGATNLTSLQTLCVDERRQTFNHCLTARYRLRPSAAVGTLLLAFINDLIKISHGEKETVGDLRAPKSKTDDSDEFKRFAELFLKRMDSSLSSLLEPKQGAVEGEQLAMLSEALKNESFLTRGNRLVLFGEIAEEAATANEWPAATERLFAQLPERVGLVFAGAPQDFEIPPRDPHFLEITLPKGDDTVADANAPSVYKFTDSSFHVDEPASKDQLGVNDYANALARFIVHPQTRAPLTLGINGRWGKGKSSFMRLVDTALVKHADVNRNMKRPELNGETRAQRWNDLAVKLSSPSTGGKAGLSKEQQEELEKDSQSEAELWKVMLKDAQRDVLSVTFNAWQFEDAKQTWAGLASQISETIEESLSWWARQRLAFLYAWKERKTELILTLLLPLAIVLMALGLTFAGFFAKLDIKPEGLGVLLPVGSTFLAAWFVSSQVIKVAVPVSERVLSYTRMPNYREQMGFQHRVKDDLHFIHRFLTKHRPGCRVVVYIDDLDRCSESKIMELLQAINLILADSKFFVFVGMDTEMIYRAIRSYYKETPTERSPESYLRKIVQISFYLPETISQTRADYVSTLFSSEARLGLADLSSGQAGEKPLEQSGEIGPTSGLPYDLGNVLPIVIPTVPKEVEDTADELEAFCDYSDYLNDNPREIKRLINVHRLIKILLQKPNSPPWSTERQRKLVKWLIFCDRWPHLVDDVLELEGPESFNILNVLEESLTEKEKNRKGTGAPILFDGLRDFAHGVKPGSDKKPRLPNTLLFEDVDEQFRSAAKFSQLIIESHAADAKTEAPNRAEIEAKLPPLTGATLVPADSQRR